MLLHVEACVLAQQLEICAMVSHLFEILSPTLQRFTGWCDVPLTEHGEDDARDAGHLMGDRELKFDVVFTSNLERAWRTASIALSEAGQSGCEVVRSWKLNERHYGALQGHLKNCPTLIQNFGESKLLEWRRSYTTPPPALTDVGVKERLVPGSVSLAKDFMDPRYDHPLMPKTESLKDCEERCFGYWKEVIAPRVKDGERVLIVAHANTIRTLVRAIDKIDDSKMAHLKIPNGVPLVYTLDRNLEPIFEIPDDDAFGFQAKYLISPHNHEKMMAYELCTKKKLISLFEYLDKDRDGRITPACLQSGLTRLQSYAPQSVICEFEVEELLRCVPEADEHGGVTLKAFLDNQSNLLPGLSRLRLLQ